MNAYSIGVRTVVIIATNEIDEIKESRAHNGMHSDCCCNIWH